MHTPQNSNVLVCVCVSARILHTLSCMQNKIRRVRNRQTPAAAAPAPAPLCHLFERKQGSKGTGGRGGARVEFWSLFPPPMESSCILRFFFLFFTLCHIPFSLAPFSRHRGHLQLSCEEEQEEWVSTSYSCGQNKGHAGERLQVQGVALWISERIGQLCVSDRYYL